MKLITKTGEGGAEVVCTFDLNSDGEVDGLKVAFCGVDVLALLSLEQVEAIELECLHRYMDEAKQSNTDAAIERHLSNIEMP